jgi:hypothetical protein
MPKESLNPKAQSGLGKKRSLGTILQLNSMKLKTLKTLVPVKLQLQRVFTDWGIETTLKSQGK